MRSARSGALLIAVLGTLAGCGGVQSPDLFVVARDGSIPGARLDLIVSDDGSVRCNGHTKKLLPNELLLEARDVTRELKPDATRGLTLAHTGNAVLTYRVRDGDGHVTFPDTAAPGRPVLARLALLVRQTAKQVCGLAR